MAHASDPAGHDNDVPTHRVEHTLAEVQALLEAARWTFAKTCPQNPHYWSTIQQWKDPTEFIACVRYIYEHGEFEVWRDRVNYTVLHLNGWKYWSMNDPIPKTVLMNRCVSNRGKKGA